MLETNIENFIIHGCREEVKRYKSIFKQPNILNYDRNQWTYIVEIMIITIKSLVPCNSSYGSVIDYKRFNEELRLWYYYRHGDNRCLLGSLDNDEKAYWEEYDESICSRIAPIVFANEDWLVARYEVLKNILYTTGRISAIFESLALAKLLFVFIGNTSISHENLISQIKEEIICFSQKKFIDDHAENFRFSFSTYKGSYIVDFEKRRIELLNTLNEIDKSSNYNTLKQSLDMLKELEKDHIVPSFFPGGLRGLKSYYGNNNIKDEDFIKNLCSFLVKLRKGRISLESLHIEKYILPDIFQYEEGDLFFHTLFKKCQIIKKISEHDTVISFIRTKLGIYRFEKNIK